MTKIFLLIVLLISTLKMNSQTINWVGQSKGFIEKQCKDAGFILFSDKENEQKYEITSSGKDFAIFIKLDYKNGYCDSQAIFGHCNENDNEKLENIMKKYFCKNWEEIDSTHLKCGTVISHLTKTFKNGIFVYVLWWLNNEN